MYIFNHLLNNQKKLGLNLLIIFGLILNPIFLINQANAAIGGWTLSNPVAQGATAVYDATKTVLINGKNVVKTSSISIAPTAANVAKVLARGGAAAALSVAVEQLIGAVSWVMDPAQSAIKYYEITDPSQADRIWWIGDKTLWGVCYSESSCTTTYLRWMTGFESAKNPKAACKRTNNTMSCSGTADGGRTFSNNMSTSAQTPAQEKELKSLPLTTVAAQVISNAESNTDKKVSAQVATMAAAQDIVNEAESDNVKALPITTALDKAASTATSETATGEATQTKTDPVTGEPVTETTDIALEFPSFCGWAPVVCEAAQTVISFPQTLTNWWETGTKAVTETWVAVQEWAKEETPQKENTELEIDETPPQVEQVNASFGDKICPSMSVSWHLPFSNISLDLTPTKLCEIASGVQGFVIALGFYCAAQIVGRRV